MEYDTGAIVLMENRNVLRERCPSVTVSCTNPTGTGLGNLADEVKYHIYLSMR